MGDRLAIRSWTPRQPRVSQSGVSLPFFAAAVQRMPSRSTLQYEIGIYVVLGMYTVPLLLFALIHLKLAFFGAWGLLSGLPMPHASATSLRSSSLILNPTAVALLRGL